MRATHFLACLLAVSMLFVNSCKKETSDEEEFEDNCTTCVNQAEALAAYNESSGGVYKGVFLGSSGYFVLNLKNGNGNVSGKLTLDGKTATLTADGLAGWEPGQAVDNALFTGTIDGKNIQLHFSVAANGNAPKITLSIPGHNVVAMIIKETSSQNVKIYEGDYTGKKDGTTDTVSGGFNMLVHQKTCRIIMNTGYLGLTKLDKKGDDLNATLPGNTTTGKIKLIGKFGNNGATQGKWDAVNARGTWHALRTL